MLVTSEVTPYFSKWNFFLFDATHDVTDKIVVILLCILLEWKLEIHWTASASSVTVNVFNNMTHYEQLTLKAPVV